MADAKWELRRGFSDWGMNCQHDIVDGEEIITSIPSLTPYCIGASAKDKAYARRQWRNALLLFAAPELLEACKLALQEPIHPKTHEIIAAAIAKAEGK